MVLEAPVPLRLVGCRGDLQLCKLVAYSYSVLEVVLPPKLHYSLPECRLSVAALPHGRCLPGSLSCLTHCMPPWFLHPELRQCWNKMVNWHGLLLCPLEQWPDLPSNLGSLEPQRRAVTLDAS